MGEESGRCRPGPGQAPRPRGAVSDLLPAQRQEHGWAGYWRTAPRQPGQGLCRVPPGGAVGQTRDGNASEERVNHEFTKDTKRSIEPEPTQRSANDCLEFERSAAAG